MTPIKTILSPMAVIDCFHSVWYWTIVLNIEFLYVVLFYLRKKMGLVHNSTSYNDVVSSIYKHHLLYSPTLYSLLLSPMQDVLLGFFAFGLKRFSSVGPDASLSKQSV